MARGGRCGQNWWNQGFRPRIRPKTRVFLDRNMDHLTSGWPGTHYFKGDANRYVPPNVILIKKVPRFSVSIDIDVPCWAFYHSFDQYCYLGHIRRAVLFFEFGIFGLKFRRRKFNCVHQPLLFHWGGICHRLAALWDRDATISQFSVRTSFNTTVLGCSLWLEMCLPQ